MCTVMINIDEAQVRKVNPALTSKEDITRWAQQLVDACIADLAEEEEYPLPEGLKPYTIEELHERIIEEVNAMLDAAEADFEAGIGIPNEVVMREWKEDIARWEAEEEAQKKAIAYVEEEMLEAV